MKKIVAVSIVIFIISALALIKVEKPCGKISGIDGNTYTMYTKESFFESSNIYYKDENGDIVSHSLAEAIRNCRACSVCKHYIDGGYTKFGNEYFCSDECYEQWRIALLRELGR